MFCVVGTKCWTVDGNERAREEKTHGAPALDFLLGMLELIMAETAWGVPGVG